MDKALLENLGWILFCLGFITCTWDEFLKGGVFGFHVKIHTAFFFSSLLIQIYLYKMETVKKILSFSRVKFILPMIFLIVYYLATIPWSYFPLKTFLYAGWIGFNALTIWANTGLWVGRVPKEKFYQLVFVSITIQSVIILVDQVAHGFGYTGGLIGVNQDIGLRWGLSRPSGFSSEPSYISAFMSLALIFLLPWILKSSRWYISALAIVSLFAMVSTTSRTGWIALGMGVFICHGLAALRNRKIHWAPILKAGSLLIFIGAIYGITLPKNQRQIVEENLISPLYKAQSSSVAARFQAHISAWTMAKETHFLGTGLGASYWYWITHHETKELYEYDGVGKYTLNLDPMKGRFGKEVVMSTWGQILAEAGLVGVLLYAFAAYFLLHDLWKRWWDSGDDYNLHIFGSAIVFFSFTAFSIGNIARGDVWVWYGLWSHLALASAVGLGGSGRASSIQ